MSEDKVIHFGQFVRRQRIEKGLTLKAFAEIVGITDVRMNAVEKMEKPTVQDVTRSGIARAVGMTLDEFDQAWQTTPVRPLKRKEGAVSRNPIADRNLDQLFDELEELIELVIQQGIPREEALLRLQQKRIDQHRDAGGMFDSAEERSRAEIAKKSAPNLLSGADLQRQHDAGLREAASHSDAARKKLEQKRKNRGKS